MRKIVVSQQLTLDGVMQAPGHPDEDRSGGFEHGGWHLPYFDPTAAEAIGESMQRMDAFLFGRRTYEIMASFWPHAPEDDMFTKVMNSTPKYVASTTLEEPLEWENSTLLSGELADAVRDLKQQPGGDIVVLGSRDLVHSLLDHGLVDELTLMIDPLVLDSGKRLFDGVGRRLDLELIDATPTTTGVIMASYRLAAA